MTKGSCLCGSVQFEVSGPLGDVRLCYCSLCRRANGSVFSANTRVPLTRYKLTSGKEQITEFESSPGAFKAFCSSCGSPVYSRVQADPAHIRLRLGTLDERADAKITAHVWVGSKPAWFAIADDLPQHECGANGPLRPK